MTHKRYILLSTKNINFDFYLNLTPKIPSVLLTNFCSQFL
jgi:hypothetical protein